MLNTLNAAFTIRAYNELLTQKCMSLLLKQNNYPVLPFFETTAESYLYDIIYSTTYDYIINIDEDAFVFDMDALLTLLDHIHATDTIICGLSDAVLPARGMNPFSLNPFFNIFNAKCIRKIPWGDLRLAGVSFDCKAHQLPECVRNNNYILSLTEPYYPFFFGIYAQNWRTLYLTRESYPGDNLADIIFDNNGKPFLAHTWYAREYKTNHETTERINNIFAWSAQKAKGTKEVRIADVLTHRVRAEYRMLKSGVKNLLRTIYCISRDLLIIAKSRVGM